MLGSPAPDKISPLIKAGWPQTPLEHFALWSIDNQAYLMGPVCLSMTRGHSRIYAPFKSHFLASGPLPLQCRAGGRDQEGKSGNWSCLGPGIVRCQDTTLPTMGATPFLITSTPVPNIALERGTHSPAANTSSSGLILLIFLVSNCLMTEEALIEVSTMPDSCTSSFFSTSGSFSSWVEATVNTFLPGTGERVARAEETK